MEMKRQKDIQINSAGQLPLNLNDYFGKETLQQAGELYEQLQRPLIKGVQLEVPLRNLNNWANVLGENPKGVWGKKYSFIEFVWIKIVEQLRNTGVNLSVIAQFKTKLLEPIKVKGILSKVEQAKHFIDDLKLGKAEKEQLLQYIASPEYKSMGEVHFTLLHIMIVESIIKKLPLALAVFLDGTFIILDKSKEHFYTDEEKNKLLYDTHVTVSVSTILKKFFLSGLSGFVVPEINLLSYPENKLFEVIHSGDYDSILINFKDKKIKTLELKKSEDIKHKIYDILDKREFGEILIKKHKGVVTKIENTFKITF